MDRSSAGLLEGRITSAQGRLVLILATRDLQSAAQLTAGGGLGPTETAVQLRRLVEQGFIIVADPANEVAVYHLRPGSAQPDDLDQSRRILLVESDLALGELISTILEEEGYAIIAAHAPADAVAILARISFDLVITDGFSKTAGAVLVNVAQLREAAGATPVVLFTAHKLDLDAVLAAGFRDLIEKPFALDAFESRIRALLPLGSPRAAGDQAQYASGKFWSTEPRLPTNGHANPALIEALRMLEQRDPTIMGLAGRVGYLQAELSQTREQVALWAPAESSASDGNLNGHVDMTPAEPLSSDVRVNAANPEPGRGPWRRFLG